MNDIAILIDCWETPYSKQKIESSPDYVMFKNIISFIESTPSIKTIILASYQSLDDKLTVWYKNYGLLFGSEALRCMDLTIDVRPFVLWKTADTILHWKTDRYQIALHELEELAVLVNDQQIDNVYLCGQSLEECVRVRPLGYESLARIIKEQNLTTKILIKDTCVNCEEGNIFDLEKHPDWFPTDKNGVFELKIV